MTKETYLKKIFQAYYREHVSEIPPIHGLVNREFAFLQWTKPGMIRHIGFMDQTGLIQDLTSNGPRHAYRSAAYYEAPSAPSMDKKKLLGCDFVVDIDADHLPTNCIKDHNYSVCKKCGADFPTENIETCPECQNTKFNKITWICDECLAATKTHIVRLIENFLLPDLGISLDEIQILFSGHRGYHIHIESEKFQHLDQDARREIIDYITGQGFSVRLANYTKVQGTMIGFRVDQLGWAGKYAREMRNLLLQNEEVFRFQLKDRLNESIIKLLLENRRYLLPIIEQKKPSWNIKGIGEKTWIQILDILRQNIMADVDVVVSIDLHRLIRLEGSIHGKSGFRMMHVGYNQLTKFDPLSDAISFPRTEENTVKLKITAPHAPKIRIGDRVYGPYIRDENIGVPLNVAIFLLCKDVADLIN